MKKRTLVFGATDKRWRFAFQAMHLLIKKGHEVYGIGKRNFELSGIQVVSTKLRIAKIHTITIYLNADNQKEYYEYIIELAPDRVIFNPGSENRELETILKENAINYEHSCTLVLLKTGQY